MSRVKILTRTTFVGLAIILMSSVWTGCLNREKGNFKAEDSPVQGTINISVDESFKPVIDEQIKVYESSYPGAHIIVHYKPEAECFADLMKDSSNRMIIVTRGSSAAEDRYLKDSLGFVPQWTYIASDAVTLVVNKESTDTLFTMDRLKQQLSGVLGNKETFVFDGLNATSTVRFMVDSILRGKAFDTGAVRGVNGNRAVLDYVAAHPEAIGLVGFSWIGNPEDTAQTNMLKKIKIAYVQCDNCVDSPYVKPTQYGIVGMRYPLVRGLYYIVKENYNGLGSGFAAFMQYERGQLIFKRGYLGSRMDFNSRQVKMK